MSDTEDQKQQIVRCIRMLERSGIMDYNGHASIRLGDNRMLINIGSCQRSRLTTEDICTIDFDGLHLHCAAAARTLSFLVE